MAQASDEQLRCLATKWIGRLCSRGLREALQLTVSLHVVVGSGVECSNLPEDIQ